MRLGPPPARINLSRALGRRLGLASSEAGFAVPTVLFMLLAAFGIASVAIVSSVQVQGGTSRDLDSKDALAVAEAGAHQALLRYNSTGGAPGTCVAPQTLAGEWCTAATGELPSGGTFTYWVKPGDGVIEVVSQAVNDGVTRRIHLVAHSAAGQQPFLDFGIIGLNGVELDSFASIDADVATNGNVEIDSNAELCGDVQHPDGFDILPPDTADHACGSEVEGEVVLPPVNQGDVRAVNDNGLLFGGPGVLVSGKPQNVCFNGYNAAGQQSSVCGTRELVIKGGGAEGGTGLTLPSGNYSLCRLELRSNSYLYIQAGATVRLWFDTPDPEGCDQPSGTVQLELDQLSRITANDPSAIDIALLFVGSDSRQTSILLSSNTQIPEICFQNFVVYAPRTDITLDSNSHYCGAIGGRSVHLNSNAHIVASNQGQNFVLPNSPPHYVTDRFVECSGPAAATPSSGC